MMSRPVESNHSRSKTKATIPPIDLQNENVCSEAASNRPTSSVFVRQRCADRDSVTSRSLLVDKSVVGHDDCNLNQFSKETSAMILRAWQNLATCVILPMVGVVAWATDVHAAQAQSLPNDSITCRDVPQPAGTQLPVVRSSENTFVFNHRDLTAEGNQPYVLKADDGGYFQVLFRCTAPAFFTYTISGDATLQPESASGATFAESIRVVEPLATRGVTMRHDARFLRYRVTARLRDGMQQPATSGLGMATPTGIQTTSPPVNPTAQPAPLVQLYSVAFDIWVITKPDWRLSVIGGVANSWRSSYSYGDCQR
jgi:hypothetical protein